VIFDHASLATKVVEMALSGDHRVLATLRQQWQSAELCNLEVTGIGYYFDISIPDGVPHLDETISFAIGDVKASLDGLKNEVGFVIFVQSGVLSMFEAHGYDGTWPEIMDVKSMAYTSDNRDLSFLNK
jgi:hypothetical protein